LSKKLISSDHKFETSKAVQNNDDYRIADQEVRYVQYNKGYTLPGVMNYVTEGLYHVSSNLNFSIDRLNDSFESIKQHENIVIKTVMGGTLTLSVGLATWILRGGSLVASALSTMPIWRGFDPMPVLSLTRKERHNKIKEIHSIEKEEGRKNKRIAGMFDNVKTQKVKKGRGGDKS
jgi:hypothetical protein